MPGAHGTLARAQGARAAFTELGRIDVLLSRRRETALLTATDRSAAEAFVRAVREEPASS